MENQLPNKKPCGSNRILYSNLAMPTTSFGYGNQESCCYRYNNNQYSDFLENMKPYEDLLTRLNKPDATEDDIKDLCERKKQYLPGYRFTPTDDKLVTQYLTKKIANQPIPSCFIRKVNVYQQHPKDLTGLYPNDSLVNKGWYFFSIRSRKYRNGSRPDRAAGNGFWKKTGSDKPVKVNDKTVGFKESLVYYEGKKPNEVKTNWIMHEFKDVEKRDRSSKGTDMKLDDCVLCRIYHNGVVNVEEDEEEKGEEEVEEDKVEKEEEGPNSEVADANQDEVYNAPSYDADDIILTELDTKNTMHLLEEKEEEGPSSKIAEANQDEVYDLLFSNFQVEEEDPSSKSAEANQDEAYNLFFSDLLVGEESPSSNNSESNLDNVYDLRFSDLSNLDLGAWFTAPESSSVT